MAAHFSAEEVVEAAVVEAAVVGREVVGDAYVSIGMAMSVKFLSYSSSDSDEESMDSLVPVAGRGGGLKDQTGRGIGRREGGGGRREG